MIRSRRSVALATALVVAAAVVPAVVFADDPPVARTARVATVAAFRLDPQATAIQVDGELNDAVWTKAPVVTGFLQRLPSEGAQATHQTEVRVWRQRGRSEARQVLVQRHLQRHGLGCRMGRGGEPARGWLARGAFTTR